MTDFNYSIDPEPAAAPQVPTGGGNQPMYGVDQRRGGMGGIVEVPQQDTAPSGYEYTVDPDTNQSQLTEKQNSYNPDQLFAAYPPAMREGLSTLTDNAIGVLHHISVSAGLPFAGLYNTLLAGADEAGPDWLGHKTNFLRDHGFDNQEAVNFVQNLIAKTGATADPKRAYDRAMADLGDEGAGLAGQSLMFLAGSAGLARAGGALEKATTASPESVIIPGKPAFGVPQFLWKGQGTLPAASASPDMAVAGTALASQAGRDATAAVGSSMKNVGENALAHPGQVAASYIGAGMGQGAGEEYGQKGGPLDRLAQSLGFTMTPEMWGALGSVLGGREGSVIGSFRRISPAAVPGEMRGTPVSGGAQINATLPDAEALLNPQREFSTEDVGNAVNGYTQSVTRWLKTAATNILGKTPNPDGSIPDLPSTTAAAAKLKDAIRDGYSRAQQIAANVFWNQVDTSPRATIPQAVAAANKVLTSEVSPTSITANIPSNFAQDILALAKNGGMPTIAQMKSLVTNMRNQAVDLGLEGKASTRTLRGNLNTLADALDQDMSNAAPDSYALQQARAFSNWLHTTFSDGPMGILAHASGSNQLNQMNPKDALQTAMGDYRLGPQAANQLPDQVNLLRTLSQPVPGQVGPQQPPSINQIAPDIAPRTADWLKSMVTDAFNQKLDPTLSENSIDGLTNARSAAVGAQKYMKSEDFQNLLKAFPQLDQEMQQHFNDMSEAIGEAHQIKNSAFFKIAGEYPETGVERLFNSTTKIADAKNIMKQMGNNPDAIGSLQYGLIRKLGNSSNWLPDKMIAAMNSKDNRQVFQTLMPNGGFERLNRILSAGKELQEGRTVEGSVFGSMSPTETAGRVIGSLLTGWSGGHSIQIHSIGTKIGGNFMQRLFHIVPPEDIIQKAMVDPNWERFLMSRLPTTMASIRATNRMMGALVGATHTANTRLMNQAFPSGTNSNANGQ